MSAPTTLAAVHVPLANWIELVYLLAAVGFIPIGDTPEEFNAYLRAESEKWGKVIRDNNITMD